MADFVSEVGDEKVKSLKKLELVKGIEPSSSAWKVVGKPNDFNEPCVKWQPKTVLNPPIFATGNEMVRSDTSYGPVFVQRLRAMAFEIDRSQPDHRGKTLTLRGSSARSAGSAWTI